MFKSLSTFTVFFLCLIFFAALYVLTLLLRFGKFAPAHSPYHEHFSHGTRPRSKIAIVSIVNDSRYIEEYRLALDSSECYSIHHGYPWIFTDVSKNATLQHLCPQPHFFFQRHCIAAQILEENDYDGILFIDSDMGVINPMKRIEDYVINRTDLIFCNRTWSDEIMAGIYLARKTSYASSFLRIWANYNYWLPNAFHGFDNVALHAAIAKVAGVSIKVCENIWNTSRSYSDTFAFVICVRRLLEQSGSWKNRILILPKGKSWARDGWLTDSGWCKNDFFFHGWKKRKLNAKTFAGWKSPLKSFIFNKSICASNDFLSNWKYEEHFVRTEEEIDAQLRRVIDHSERQFRSHRRRVDDILRSKNS